MTRPATKASGEIIAPTQQQSTLGGLLKKMQGEIAKALPKHVPPDRMARICATALRTTPNLELCTSLSFLGSVMSAAQLGLEPNTPLGHCYLIPRQNRKQGIYECTMMIGYQGMLDMARRSGLVKEVWADVVREVDEFDYELGLHRDLKHKRGNTHRSPMTHVYAVAKLTDGGALFEVLTTAEVEDRRNRSAAARKNSGPWVSDYEAMARKTAIRALWKWLPKSSEVAAGLRLDEAAELGGTTELALDPEVRGMLEEAGVEGTETIDPETGEVTNAA